MRILTLDVEKGTAVYTAETDKYRFVYYVTEDRVQETTYDLATKRELHNHSFQYEFDLKQFYASDLITWMIRGVHGRPKPVL